MGMLKKRLFYNMLLLLMASAQSKERECGADVLLEFKGAYFLGTDCVFRDIYDNGAALYGPEVTFKVARNWYGFASVDYLQKKGRSIGLCDSTKVQMVPLGIGAKYMVPFCWGDFYVGLGFQPTHVKTIDCAPFVCRERSKWGFGGIAKIGLFVDLPHNFLLDFFIDYSFVKAQFCGTQCPTGFVQSRTADVSGTIFGIGIGYRFH